MPRATRGSGRGVDGSKPIGVVVVEDEGLYRDLLRIVLSQHPRLAVLETFPDGESALERIPELRPRVAILDIELPGSINGVQLGLRLRRQLPELGVVLLSNHRDPEIIAGVPRQSIAGWSYLLKQSVGDAAALTRAIEGVAAGLVVLDPVLVDGRRPRPDEALGRLTRRQREVLALMAQGYTNAAIAERLVLAEKSVENQINLMYRELAIEREKSGLHPRVQAVLRFLQHSQPNG